LRGTRDTVLSRGRITTIGQDAIARANPASQTPCHARHMAAAARPRWWDIRRSQNRKPVTYRCPFCGKHLAALSEHVLLLPEGRAAGRRHAHTECAIAARRAGRLPTRDDWRRTQPKPPSLWRRLFGRAGA